MTPAPLWALGDLPDTALRIMRRILDGDSLSDAPWGDDLRRQLAEQQLDLDDVLRRIVDESTRRLGADRGTLYLVDPARREVVSRVAHLPEIREIRLRLGEGVAGQVAQAGRTLCFPEEPLGEPWAPRVDALTGYHTRSLLAAPVHAPDGQIVGVIQLLNKLEGAFDARDRLRLEQLADRIGELLDASSLSSQLHGAGRLPLSFRFNHIVGESAAMQRVYERTERAARTDATVLIRGESGSGKELIARAVHFNSLRRDGPFVVVDCAALPPELIENELFGHIRGAYTGADRDQTGKIESANGGTVFLDEVAELPLAVQARLLRLVQAKTFFPLGATIQKTVDVRFVCATHQDLEARVAQKSFRADLYYRLRVVQIELPPLRARGGADIDRLIDHFLFEFTRRHQRDGLRLSDRARAALHAHPWPGNVRELQHCIESAVVLSPSELITEDLLSISPAIQEPDRDGFFIEGAPTLEEVERRYIAHVLAQHEGNRSAAARTLGIGRNTLLRKLNE